MVVVEMVVLARGVVAVGRGSCSRNSSTRRRRGNSCR